ncbi:MAG: FG-GAP-like repeat-containing protein [bacterium]|nr:FG-GAP-like repeat-containing protein [bacterium]
MTTKRVGIVLVVFIVASASWAIDVPKQIQTTLDVLGALKITLPDPHHYEIGYTVSGIGDFDADGFLDAAIGAPYYNPGDFGENYDNGAVFIVFGDQLNQESGMVDLSAPDFHGMVVMGHIQSKIGNAIARIGDINADGYDDLAFGSKSQEAGYVLFGRSNPRRLFPLSELNGEGVRIANTGTTVSSAGDFNGDNYPDVIFGNPYSETVTVNAKEHPIGRVTLLFGGPQIPGELDALQHSENLLSIRGAGGALTGTSLAGQFDMNMDGFSDIFIIAPGAGNNFQGRGFLVEGNQDPSDNAIEYSFIVNHAREYTRNGKDLNGDSIPDLIVSGGDNSTHVIWGGDYLKGTINLNDELDPRWGVQIIGSSTAFGVGDLNGDGFSDLAISLPTLNVSDKTMAGCVIFLLGQKHWPETIDVQAILDGKFFAMNSVLVYGTDPFGYFGHSVAPLGDIQGDGFDDVIIGAPMEKLPGEANAEKPGSAYVIQGKTIFYTLQARRSHFTPLSLTRKNNS